MSGPDDAITEPATELVASRARILARADEGRRQLQRELHDGAQQRLVHALIVLKLAKGALDAASPAAGLVQEALTNLEQANRDLREVVHSILPPSLIHGGLRAGLQSLVDDLPVRAGLRVSAPRLPHEVETTAYLVVVEVVRIVVERAKVERIDVALDLDGDVLVVEARYRSGQCLAREPGDGLTGVRDRVRAAGGVLDVFGLADGGSVRARLPVLAETEATVRGAKGA